MLSLIIIFSAASLILFLIATFYGVYEILANEYDGDPSTSTNNTETELTPIKDVSTKALDIPTPKITFTTEKILELTEINTQKMNRIMEPNKPLSSQNVEINVVTHRKVHLKPFYQTRPNNTQYQLEFEKLWPAIT